MSHRRTILALPILAVLAAGPSQAQQFQGMENDQGLNMALQEMLNAFGGACQSMGDPNACGAFTYVQQAANYMVGASSACLQGDQMGCQAYQMAYQDVSATYAGYSQMMQGGMAGAPGGTTGGADPWARPTPTGWARSPSSGPTTPPPSTTG